MSFTHLHLHTQYSLLDSAIKIKELPKILKEKGFQACAITDKGNLHGVIEFYETLKKNQLKPIIGIEIYLANGSRFKQDYINHVPHTYQIILLIQNKQGYQNLIKLISIAYNEGKYQGIPRIDHDLLEKYHDGLIAFSGDSHGEIAQALLAKQTDEAYKLAIWYQQVFEERFYLEIQSTGLFEEQQINPQFIELSQKLQIPLVGTNNCHYKEKKDAEAHYILRLMGKQQRVTDPQILPLQTQELYIKTSEEMQNAFQELPIECLQNTAGIVDQCELDLTNKHFYLPNYPVPEETTLPAELTRRAKEGLLKRFQELDQIYDEAINQEKYYQRLEYELEIINKMDYPGYFLIVADFIKWAKNNNVSVGPGRGSGAGSLVAYSLEITDIDPLKYDLLFERFLNPERISLPDFDIDFDNAGRERVIEYVKNKYGAEKVCQISTIGSLQAKGAIRGVARVMGIPYSAADKISKLVPNELGITLEKAIEKEPELKTLLESGTDQEQKLLQIAMALEGLNSNLSTHAAGIIIMNSDITDIMPTCTSTAGDMLQSMYTMEYAESQGAVKFDFLGLRNLTVIQKAIELINFEKSSAESPINIKLIPLDDQKTFQLLCSGNTTGVFQLESSGMKKLLQRLKPDTFEDIIALVALYRPGPLGSGMVESYVECKHQRQAVVYSHPLLEDVLQETYGIMVYQEQVMRAVQVLANFSLGEADLLRRAIGKKKPEIIKEQRQIFITGCAQNNIDSEKANEIFDLIDKFAGYGFNKSHSVAYGLIGYQTAWLKANYPVEFMAALMSTEMNNPDSIVKLINECHEMGIKVLPPDLQQGELSFTTHENQIRFGLNAIKNVGVAALENILSVRHTEGSLNSLIDVFGKIDTGKVNARALEYLIKSGAFDSIEKNRHKILINLSKLIDFANTEQAFKLEEQNQISMFALLDQQNLQKTVPKIQLTSVKDWDYKTRLQYEKEALGFYVSGHPLQPYQKEIQCLPQIVSISALKNNTEQQDFYKINIIVMINSISTKINKKNKKFAILQVEDLSDKIEIIVFPKAWDNYHHLLEIDEPVLIEGQVKVQDESLRIFADTIQPFNKIRAEKAKALIINLPNNYELELLNKIKQICLQSPGDAKVYFYILTKNQCHIKYDIKINIAVSIPLINQLEECLAGFYYFTFN